MINEIFVDEERAGYKAERCVEELCDLFAGVCVFWLLNN